MIFVNRLSKMAHLVPAHATIIAVGAAVHLIDAVFCHHESSDNVVSGRYHRFKYHFGVTVRDYRGKSAGFNDGPYGYAWTNENVDRVQNMFSEVMLLCLRVKVHS